MASPATSTRKIVTVLFCDLVGSTELGERLDPERLRELLTRWYEAMRIPIDRHGGEVEKFVGDAVMAVFGIPHVHEDDALRAVRAAIDMRAAVAALNDELAGSRQPGLEVRIGINTGEVVTGHASTTLVSGDAVNTAKRLEQAAPSGEILLGSATRRLVENAVQLEPVAAVSAKGKGRPVEAWRVLATIPGAGTFARRLDGRLIGRERELAFLRDELRAARDERACRLVTVFGPAGIGKSRLAAELDAELTARCLPYGDGISLLPLADLVRSAGGEDAVLRAVEAEPDGALIASRICGAAATPEELQWAVRRMLETLARERTLVVCIEDVHWAQPAFLDLLEYLVGWCRDAAILLLCLARPELLDVRPRWPGASVTLAPLTDAESATLLDELADEWPLTPAARAQIAEAAEGNPLFLEQMVAMLADGASKPELPPTIQALLAARLEALEPAERAILERAAVVGRDFTRGAVAALADGDTSATLLALARKELVRPAVSAYSGDDGFRFRHALIRDAAYAAMSKRLRAELHERHAEWLGEHRADDELVGYHLEQAHRFLVELGRRDQELGRRAGELLAGAGVRASARGDAPAARTLLTRSLALLPAQHEGRIDILRELSAALWLVGDVDAAELALSESIDLARTRDDTRREWYGRLERAARAATAQGETAALVATATRAIEVFERLGEDLGLARAWRRLGLVAHTECRFARAADAFERSYRYAQASGDEQERSRSADALCSALVSGPARVDEAIPHVESILALAAENMPMRAHVSTSLAALVAMQADFERARAVLAEAGAVYGDLGLTLPRLGWLEVVARVELLADEPRAAIEALEEGYAIVDAGGLESLRRQYASLLALVHASRGDRDAAHAYSRVAASVHAVSRPDALAHLRAAQALIAGESYDARRLVTEAVEAAERTEDPTQRAWMGLIEARVTHDPAPLARAQALLNAKGNVAAAALVRAAERDIVAAT
jgi:class 3 adenylate cyclase/tetratricopeptide (TPR) repeat protein